MELISARQAAVMGAVRLRKPIWSDPLDHLRIDIVHGELGPWMHLYCPFNRECNGRDPVDMLWGMWGSPDVAEYEIYDGPLPNSDEYITAADQFAGVLG